MLRACLDSVVAYPPLGGAKVHVVDNASRDGTVEMVRREFQHVSLHASPSNLGFSRANNIAIRDGSAPFVLALNPDTRLTPGVLDHLLDLMATNPRIGMAGCQLVREDGTLDHAAKRAFPTPLSALGHFTHLGRRAGATGSLAAYRAPDVDSGPVDAINGAFMLMRRSALEEVGLFDEGYWMYMEDLDLCYRFAAAGWVTWYEPSVSILHIKAGTSGAARSPKLTYAFHYGMFRFYRKFYASKHRGWTNFIVYTGIAIKLVSSTLTSLVRRRLVSRART